MKRSLDQPRSFIRHGHRAGCRSAQDHRSPREDPVSARRSRPSRAARAGIAIAVLAGALAAALPLKAHDFWLVPDAFRIAVGDILQLRGQTSSAFPSSEAAVGAERVASARLIEAEGERALGELARAGTSLLIRHRPDRAGQKIVALTLHPVSVRESAESFRRYLALEGVPETLARLEREGRLPADSVTRRYTKYAKALVEVGAGGARVATRRVGHPLEFVPLRDPSSLRAGDTIAVLLLFEGQPLPAAKVHAGVVPVTPGAALDALAGTERHEELTTDADGRVQLPLGEAGLWNLRTLQIMAAPPGTGADWDSHWATLVFEIAENDHRRTGSARGEAPALPDSAAVAAVVDRFHTALAEGDSAAVAHLLAPDAIILENGGVETRGEYLGGHLRGDIAFAQAVVPERAPTRVVVAGDAAWAVSTSSARGEFRGRPVNAVGAELMVLRRANDGWRIVAIHWSSRPLR
jgi:ketosteroid isomerase-like protein